MQTKTRQQLDLALTSLSGMMRLMSPGFALMALLIELEVQEEVGAQQASSEALFFLGEVGVGPMHFVA